MLRYPRKTGARNISPNIHVNIPYMTGFYSFKCLPLETSSFKWHEDVTADFGMAFWSVPNGLTASMTVGENKSPSNLMWGLVFPHGKTNIPGNIGMGWTIKPEIWVTILYAGKQSTPPSTAGERVCCCGFNCPTFLTVQIHFCRLSVFPAVY